MTNDDPFFRPPRQTRRAQAKEQLARLDLTADAPEPQAIVERQQRERAERLARHDALFEIRMETSNRDLARRMGYSVGDEQGRDD